ncbi:MAG: pantetheine-phosphate adenylyltransferase [Prevotellaceae bacterium]|jgi:pantetheine-phosphate adenylyltransferase|nr:pantetheine-phosphate adenylyltransferase [Prevotellaceae bacterium]
MKKIAIFPGSFDPFTIGHESLVIRALQLFDKIIIAVGHNAQKHGFFSIDARMEMIQKIFEGNNRIEVDSYDGLTVDYCRKKNIYFIIRGLRTSADFEFERSVGQVNKQMERKIETVFLLTSTKYTPISSSIVRDILANNGNANQFIPNKINIDDYMNK